MDVPGMMVYVLTQWDEEGTTMVGIFSSEARAEDCQKRIEEYDPSGFYSGFDISAHRVL